MKECLSISIRSLVSRTHVFLTHMGLACALVVTLPTQAYAEVVSGNQSFTYAVELYKSGKFSAAYGRFQALANAGDLQSAKIALFMARNGALLYSTEWSATQSEIDRWLAMTSDRSSLANLIAQE